MTPTQRPSGAADPQPLTGEILLNVLMTARKRGTITPSKPMSADLLVQNLSKYRNVRTTKRELRATANALTDQRKPICSTNRGYYYPLSADDYTAAIEYLNSYIKELSQRVAGLRAAQKIIRESESALIDHPIVDALKREFGAERIQA